MPTQQMSFSILNLKDIVSSPLGQFTVAAWRGKEDRKMLSSHMIENFEQLGLQGMALLSKLVKPK